MAKQGVYDEDTVIQAVNVQCMHLGWLKAGQIKTADGDERRNFLSLVKILNKTSNKEVLKTNFVNCMIENYWEIYKNKIMKT